MTFLETILTSAGTTAIVAALISLAGRAFVKGAIDALFQTRLEEHKHRLEVLTEGVRFDLERKMADFSHFIKERHEKYAKLHELIHVANGLLRTLWGFKRELTFEEFSVADMRKHLQGRGIVEGKIDDILKDWETNRPSAVKNAREYLLMIEHQRADTARNEAKNYLLLNAIYVSNHLEGKVQEFLSKMVELQVLYDMWTEHGPSLRDEYQKSKSIEKEIDVLLQEIKDLMRMELSMGAVGYSPKG